jgi:molybdopterin-guanine dinucleotide biosynthesis protein A
MKNTITGYILAGGKSQRMGTDKGLLLLDGIPFVSHISRALRPIVDEVVIISSNADYDFLGYTRIEDLIPDKGPVGGIYTALKNSKTKLNIILSVDAPLVSTEFLQWILDHHKESFLMTQVRTNDKNHPLIAVYDQSLATVFEEHLVNDQLKLRMVIERVRHQTLLVPEKWNHQTQNINTKEEYQNLQL